MGLQGYCRRGQGVSPTGNGMSRVPGSKMSMANGYSIEYPQAERMNGI